MIDDCEGSHDADFRMTGQSDTLSFGFIGGQRGSEGTTGGEVR